jgi:hypothetical protein
MLTYFPSEHADTQGATQCYSRDVFSLSVYLKGIIHDHGPVLFCVMTCIVVSSWKFQRILPFEHRLGSKTAFNKVFPLLMAGDCVLRPNGQSH